ncbi:serine/threonine-protein kinase PrkC [bacterium BMS3Abin04]|nr:serine/threonine-protein kinase PrkC [bacterium BMS3Abin04]
MNKINETLKVIFEKALLLNKTEREEYFKSLPRNERIYIDEVKSLITSYENTEDFLEPASNQKEIISFDKNQPHPLTGKHIGHYLIESEVGMGGMGIVFIGKRDDKSFDQKVAIKILKQGLTTQYLVKRFENERQILANLQHPNIAKLFDGGKTGDGLPYLVMEYIEGVPITEYYNNNNLNINDKLELFITVCSAVQYAHQNLIVHRDLKPGNILVNKQGRPKLLDFGIAKLLDESLLQENIKLTQTKMMYLTPEYASPEQINGQNITTSSDIYSLGVLLYQLLTGHQPYRINNLSPLQISKIITDEKVTKPSDILKSKTSTSDGKDCEVRNDNLRRTLKGDLDNIILKAMHKDPLQRYGSVQEFADDIKRYLTCLPVIAGKDTLPYRFNKFVKRHKVGVALFILFNVIILSSIIAVIYQGKIAVEERDKAKIENQKFEKVNSFLQEMLSSVDPSEIGRDVKVYDVLQKAAKNAETELKNQPGIEAVIRSTIGNTYVNLGEYDKGKPFLDKAYQLNIPLYGEQSKEVAASIHDLALYYDWIGEYKIADSLYAKSIKVFRKTLTKPTNFFADALNNHAIIKMNLSQNEEAEKLYLEAIETSIKTNGMKNRNTAVMMNNLAINYMDSGNLDEAEKYYKKSLAIILEVLGENRPEAGSAYNNMARLYMYKSEFDSAEIYLNKSYELKYKLKGKDHPDVGLALNNLGVLQIHKKDNEKAEKYLLDAIIQYRKTLQTDHPLIATTNCWLGKISMESNKFKAAENYFRKCLSAREKKLPEDNREIWQTKGELGICLLKLKKYKEAGKLLTTSYEYYVQKLPEEKKKIKRLLTNVIRLYKEIGNTLKTEFYHSELEKLSDKNTILK